MSFENLPVELLFDLLEYLPISSLIALKLSSKQLFPKLPSPPPGWLRKAPPCERNSALRYTAERKDLEYGRRRCVVCGSYALLDGLIGGTPICLAHEGRFMATEIPAFLEPELKRKLEDFSKARQHTIWVAIKRNYCVHQKMVENWDCTEGSCECDCDSCGHWPLWCYVRVAGHPTQMTDFKPLSFRLRTDDNDTYVVEKHSNYFPSAWPGESTSNGNYHVAVPAMELAD